MKVENSKSEYQISDEIQALYKILNSLSYAISSYNESAGNPATQVCAYAPDTSIPEALNVRDLIKEFGIEVNKLQVPLLSDLEVEESKEEDTVDIERFEVEGLEDIEDEELIKLNFLKLTTKEEVFNSYKEELEEKYNG